MRLAVVGMMAVAVLLAGCQHRASSRVAGADPAAASLPAATKRAPADIQILTTDITDRKYVSLGEITVHIKRNIYADTPMSDDHARAELAKKASEIGADAVVLATYQREFVSAFSWGGIVGKGRAVRFTE